MLIVYYNVLYTNIESVSVFVPCIVIVMDKDPAKIAFARNNARVYGVEDRILFLVGDFFDHAQSLKKVDGIITSPPVDIGIDNLEKFIEVSHKLATKVLIHLPKKKEKSDVGQQILL